MDGLTALSKFLALATTSKIERLRIALKEWLCSFHVQSSFFSTFAALS
jgi:hypothetical protein